MFKWLFEAAFGDRPSPGQVWLAIASGLLGAALAAACMIHAGHVMAPWQWSVLLVMAFDISGGVAATATDAAARRNHRPDAPMRPTLFALAHVHPFIALAVLPGMHWYLATVLWAGAYVSAVLVDIAADRLKRPLSLALCAPLLGLLAFVEQDGWQWFVPAYLLKLVAAHAVPART